MIIEQIAHSAKNNPEKCAIIRGKSKITYFLLWRSIQQALAVRRQMVWDIFDILGRRLWFI